MQYNRGVRAGVGLIGRDDEIDTLTRFLDGAGRGALVIRGEAGVGKTALAEEIVDRAVGAGWRVVRATGVEAERSFALSGLNQIVFALRTELTQLGDDDQTVLAPVLRADAMSSPDPMQLVMALLSLLTHTARHASLLLVVEDIALVRRRQHERAQRGGAPSVRLTAELRGDRPPGAWRPCRRRVGRDESSPTYRGRCRTSGRPHCVVADRLDATDDPRRGRRQSACSAGVAPKSGQMDTWTTTMPLTDRLVTVFGSRLQRLDDRVRTELFARRTRRHPGDHVRRRRRPLRHDRRRRCGGSRFARERSFGRRRVPSSLGAGGRHPSSQCIAAPPGTCTSRTALRRRVDATRHTLSAAATGPDQEVADLLDRAAHLSIRLGGSAIAVDWLRRAAQLCTDPARRERLRGDAAFVASQASRFDDARRLADDTLAEQESAASVLTATYVALYRDGDVLSSHRRLLHALAGADTPDDATVIWLAKLLLGVTLYNGDPERWQQTDAVFDRLAPRLDADALLFRDSWGDVCHRGHTVRRRLDERRAQLGRREPWDVMRLGVAAYYVEGLADLRATLATLFHRESDRGAVANAMTMLHLILLDQLATGDWDEARKSIRLRRDLTELHHNELFRYQFITYDGLHAAATGDFETARRRATEVQTWTGPRRLGLLSTIVRRTKTLMALGAADYPAALAATTDGHVAERFPPYSKQPTEELLDVLDAAVRSGNRERAQAYSDQAIQLCIADISPRLTALTVAVRTMTAADESAAELYDQALAHPGLSQIRSKTTESGCRMGCGCGDVTEPPRLGSISLEQPTDSAHCLRTRGNDALPVSCGHPAQR